MSDNLQPQIVDVKYSKAPDSQHDILLQAVRQRRKMSYDKMSLRYEAYADMEEKFRAYVKPTKGDLKRTDLKKEGKPQFTTVEIPYSFALLMTLHTYLTSVMLSRNPVLQYEGRHGESQSHVLSVEALMDYQMNVGKMLVPLYIWLMDMGKYGLGVIGHHWAEESVVTSQTVEMPMTYFGIPIPGKTTKKRQTIRIPGYKGNKLYNVRPQDFFPDPRVTIARFQEGEFCGRRVECGWNTVLKGQNDGKFYNVEELKKKIKTRFDNQTRDKGSSQLVLPDGLETYYIPQGSNSESTTEIKNFVELFELQIELVPKDWKLGSSTYPEKWVITVANDDVIVSVEPLGLHHDQFTFDVLEYEIEGYALSKRSMLEVLAPLNDTMSWLFNTHMHNVRKALNDQLIVDPSMITMKDIMDPNAGRLVRLKPAAYGKDARLAVHQLQVVDITQNHMRDAMMMGEMMQRISGVVESVMGMTSSNPGSRKTATEVRTSSSFSVNRLKTQVEYASAMGFTPMAQKLLQTTQQKYDQQLIFRIAGDLDQGKTPMKVDAASIAGFYDFVAIDGSMPVDRYAQAMLWKELLMGMKQFPELAQRLDLLRILEHIAMLSGVKDFDQFEIKVTPDAVLQQQAAAGNVVPLQGVPSAGRTQTPVGPGTAEGSVGNSGEIPQLGAVAGVGRAG